MRALSGMMAYHANGRTLFGRNGELRVRVTPAYEDRPAVRVAVTLKYRDWSLKWADMQPDEPAVVMPLADWLLLAGIAAMVALSAVI